MRLSHDIETFSSVSLKTAGLYKYVESDDFEVLMMAYAIDNGPVELIDFAAGDSMPDWLLDYFTDPAVIKSAHNAAFERVCLAKWLATDLPINQWECTMVRAANVGLPFSLGNVSKVLGLSEQKDVTGSALIKYFSIPCKPTKANNFRERNTAADNPEAWENCKSYCVQDVVTERAIRNKLDFFHISDFEQKLWHLDQLINDTGICIDPVLVENAIRINEIHIQQLTEEAIKLTGLDNPNSPVQIRRWLASRGIITDTLRKEDITDLLKEVKDPIVRRVLQIRQQTGKSSVSKYAAMQESVCKDGRIRGVLQFYGANRTGRWAGRLVQVHNLPKNVLKDLDYARNLVLNSDIESLELIYGNISYILSQLIRTAFVAEPGSRLLPGDFAAIEARVIAWLADENWRLEVFKTHGKIYEASASAMFNIPLEQITEDSEYRALGKIAELALGFQGGVGALAKMDHKKELDPSKMKELVDRWRSANKKIVAMWYAMQDCAIEAVQTGAKTQYRFKNGTIYFHCERNVLFITLPSGRKLSYMRPKLRAGKYGPQLTYQAQDKVWCTQETYGGKIVENVVQAIARDLLAEKLLDLHENEYKLVMHVHDEAVPEMPYGMGSVLEIKQIMSKPIAWAPNLPLAAKVFETSYYKKD